VLILWRSWVLRRSLRVLWNMKPSLLQMEAIRKAAAASERLAALKAKYPLGFARLWHRKLPRTSQRRAMRRFTRDKIMCFILGGNRTGKSELGGMWTVCQALGRDHPIAAAFIKNNGLDPLCFPEGPGVMWAIALSHKDSRRYVRKKIATYLPSGCKFRSWNADDECEVTLPNGGRIVCKAVKQGESAFQGDDIRGAWFDEEPPNYKVVTETLMRLADQRGKMLFTMTPLKGQTKMLREFVLAKVKDPDVVVSWLHGMDNPHVPADFLEKLYRKQGAHERRARQYGEIVALEGRVYAEWQQQVHVIDHYSEIGMTGKDWAAADSYGGIDFGTRNPFCYLLARHWVEKDIIIVSKEHYQAEWSLGRHAKRIRELEKGHDILNRFADPAGAQERVDLEWEHDIETETAIKDVRAGISEVASRLTISEDGKAGIYVLSECENLVREWGSYVWDERTTKTDQPEAPLKKDDHAMDVIRYVCMGVRDSGFGCG